MNAALRRIGVVSAWVLLVLVIALTNLALLAFLIVVGLSGGDDTMELAAIASFVLLIIEVTVAMRLSFRRRARYADLND